MWGVILNKWVHTWISYMLINYCIYLYMGQKKLSLIFRISNLRIWTVHRRHVHSLAFSLINKSLILFDLQFRRNTGLYKRNTLRTPLLLNKFFLLHKLKIYLKAKIRGFFNEIKVNPPHEASYHIKRWVSTKGKVAGTSIRNVKLIMKKMLDKFRVFGLFSLLYSQRFGRCFL